MKHIYSRCELVEKIERLERENQKLQREKLELLKEYSQYVLDHQRDLSLIEELIRQRDDLHACILAHETV